MQQIQLQLSDQIYDLAQRRATEAGFANLDEYIVDVVMENLTGKSLVHSHGIGIVDNFGFG